MSLEETYLTALRQVAQSAHLPQTVEDALTDAGSLLQLFHRDIFFRVDGHTLQRIGGGPAQTLQRREGQAHLAVLHDILGAAALAQLDG